MSRSFHRSRLSPAEQALIAAAVAAGQVTVLPSGRAAGLSELEIGFWPAQPERPPEIERSRRGGQATALTRSRERLG